MIVAQTMAGARREAIAAMAGSRPAMVLAAWIYALVLAHAHRVYLSEVWGYMGFLYRPLGLLEYLMIFALVAVPVATLPRQVDRPSVLILLLLYVVVFVPAVAVGLALHHESVRQYGPTLLALSLALLGIGGFTQREPPLTIRRAVASVPEALPLSFLALWVVASVVLVIAYQDIMTFAGLEEIYEQRFAVERTLGVLGYVRTYYSTVLTTGLVAFGMITGRYYQVALGLAGGVISYMIDAQKTALILPAAVALIYFAFKHNRILPCMTSVIILFIAGLSALSIALQETFLGNLMSVQFVFRTLAVPGLTIAQYHDYFGQYGYTWWTNINVVNWLVDPPRVYASDPNWPRLGEMVGEHSYGVFSYVNVNANPFSGEGVAAGGLFGIAAISLVLAAWLGFLDRAAAGWDRNLALLMTFPLAVTLTNVHLSTVLVSYGGALVTAILLLVKPNGRSPLGGAPDA